MLTEKERREIIDELKMELLSINTTKLPVARCRDGVEIPGYKFFGDAGMDVRSMEDVLIYPGETKVIPTGLVVAIPFGREIQIRPRSGLSCNTKIRISNSPGTIDCGYRKEMGVIISNDSNKLFHTINTELYGDLCREYKKEDYPVYDLDEENNRDGVYHIKVGDRVAQIVLSKYEIIEFEETELEIIKKLGRDRGGGFGHSGIK